MPSKAKQQSVQARLASLPRRKIQFEDHAHENLIHHLMLPFWMSSSQPMPSKTQISLQGEVLRPQNILSGLAIQLSLLRHTEGIEGSGETGEQREQRKERREKRLTRYVVRAGIQYRL